MTKQEKFLLLVVLLVAGVGATIYVSNQKEADSAVSQVQTTPLNTVTNVVTPTTVDNTAQPENANTTITPTNNTNTSNTATTNTVSKKNATVSYGVPSGDTETLSVIVTTTGGIISDISFSMTPTNRESGEWYGKFKNSFPKSQIVGKSLNNVSLSRVGGASLTTAAFNKAIGELRG